MIKSAYQLALERLGKTSPTVALTDEQKRQLAEIDSKHRAKIAEREVYLKDQIRKAQVAGKLDEAETLQKQLALEIRRLQEECEAQKEKLRASFKSG
jgi:ABC-type phosphate transport system auxiliary subunit